MSNWDNQSTRLVQEEMDASYDEGLVQGYETPPHLPLPEFFSKPYYMLTARQRAFIFGREVRLQEMAGR